MTKFAPAVVCAVAWALLGACTLPDVRVEQSKAAAETSNKHGPTDVAEVRDAGQSAGRDGSIADSGSEPAAAGHGGERSDADGGRKRASRGEDVQAPEAGGESTPSADGGGMLSEEDGGVSEELAALALHEYEQFREVQKRAIDLVCDRFVSAEARMIDPENSYEHRMACEANWGLHQAGQAKCVRSIIAREPIEAIPVVQCRVAVFESLSQCLAFEFDWSDQTDIDTLNTCMDQFNDGSASCVKYPMWLREMLNVCYGQADAFWAYVDVVYAQAERVCSCFEALGYDSLDACRQGEGIVYSEFSGLETCFFELNGELGTTGGERASASVYYACDQMRMTEYASCIESVSMCDASGAMRCKNAYRVDRAVCRNEAHFLRDPYETCSQ